MRIIVSNASDDPLYLQITKQIKDSILKGELTAGTALPSMRTLAKDLQISVITTKHAYEKLEQEGFIEMVPGKGSFISMQNKELLRENELRTIEEKLAEAVAKGRLLNINLEQLQEMLRLLWEEM